MLSFLYQGVHRCEGAGTIAVFPLTGCPALLRSGYQCCLSSTRVSNVVKERVLMLSFLCQDVQRCEATGTDAVFLLPGYPALQRSGYRCCLSSTRVSSIAKEWVPVLSFLSSFASLDTLVEEREPWYPLLLIAGHPGRGKTALVPAPSHRWTPW